MIAYLKGAARAIGSNYVIIVPHEAPGLGYRLTLPVAMLLGIREGETVEFFVHEHQRDDGRELYGFSSHENLELAEKLLTVSGVGPKIAQTLVGIGAEKVTGAIRAGDPNVFLAVSGIGKKRAQQIILELKGTIDTQNLDGGAKDDLTLALEQLGYGGKEINETLRKIPRSGSTEERLRAALGLMGR
ncbi:MAG: Holliday junction branch migration protein RuvA [bacterium]